MHLGNVRTALLAWLHARLHKGQFLLRIEDLDTPRVVAGSAGQILSDLEWLGMDWDGEVVCQSARHELYAQALLALSEKDLTYECFCSRQDIRLAASAPHKSSPAYPGTCAALDAATIANKRLHKKPAIRVRVGNETTSFTDGCIGEYAEQLSKTCGDFVVRRADDLFAYQLAVIVDDLQQGITDVVRGEDLLDSSTRQIYLARQLGADNRIPNYWHVPLMYDANGKRMSKRYGSPSLAEWRADGNTAQALIGYLAADAGLLPEAIPLSLNDLLQELSADDWRNACASASRRS